MLRRLDWVLALAVLALCAIGTVLVFSATRGRLADAGSDPMGYLKRNVLNIAIGLALATAIALFDYRMLRAYAPFVYIASVIGLLAVLSPLGSTVNGSHSWIILPGGFSVQPSEFAKVALCVGLAMILSEKRDAEDQPRIVDVGIALVVAAVPIALIMLQPDLGTTIIVGFIVLGILAVAGTPAPWLAGLVALGVLGAGLAIQAGVLSTYQLNRFAAFTNPEFDPAGAGYQLKQARIAIGSGGFNGSGLFQGTQTNGKFIPEQQTDFIFTVAGEELGFVGAAAIIVLLGIVVWRAMRIALRAEDMFGRLVAAGIVCWFTFQMFENIGMTLGIMPMTGVPLPFVSYGGSSMFASLMAIGLLENVHMRRYA
ncbi:MAG TPA: rod shape-determining protein RodA [Candidatus Limnocylindria bacterium]|nr:rod shape-determining protein RodA [Candidatus Limnocylindria bacterium]